MSFSPLPLQAKYHDIANSAAGFWRIFSTRVAASIKLAPRNISRMLMPCSAAGTSPTAESSEVLPPIQSYIGKVSSQPFPIAYFSKALPTPVMAIACLAKSKPAFWKANSASFIPLAASGVPPDLEITSTKVVLRRSPKRSSTKSMPSGSELSIKLILRGTSAWARACATNCGPSAEPPIPMDKISVNFGAVGGWMFPVWTFWVNSSMRSRVSVISLRNSFVGASSGDRSQ